MEYSQLLGNKKVMDKLIPFESPTHLTCFYFFVQEIFLGGRLHSATLKSSDETHCFCSSILHINEMCSQKSNLGFLVNVLESLENR